MHKERARTRCVGSGGGLYRFKGRDRQVKGYEAQDCVGLPQTLFPKSSTLKGSSSHILRVSPSWGAFKDVWVSLKNHSKRPFILASRVEPSNTRFGNYLLSATLNRDPTLP
jgi:hypothetical protein